MLEGAGDEEQQVEDAYRRDEQLRVSYVAVEHVQLGQSPQQLHRHGLLDWILVVTSMQRLTAAEMT